LHDQHVVAHVEHQVRRQLADPASAFGIGQSTTRAPLSRASANSASTRASWRALIMQL
jgi:hypothetical protein